MTLESCPRDQEIPTSVSANGYPLPLRPDSEDLKILKARAAELGLEPDELLSNLIRRNLRDANRFISFQITSVSQCFLAFPAVSSRRPFATWKLALPEFV
jgi:hypothetical protein